MLTLIQPRVVELGDRLPSPPEASSSIPQLEWVAMICLVVPTRVSRAKAAPSRKQDQTPKLLGVWARAGKSPRPFRVLKPKGPAASPYRPRPSFQHESKGTHLPTSHPRPARNLCLGLGALIRNRQAGCRGRGHGLRGPDREIR